MSVNTNGGRASIFLILHSLFADARQAKDHARALPGSL
jgi:hypothetical protein